MIIAFYLFLALMKIVCSIPNINNKILQLFPKRNEPTSFETCYGDLGCIEVTQQWYHDDYRPINVEPLSRFVIRTEFVLYTLPNGVQKDRHHLDFEIISSKGQSLEKSRFDGKSDIIILIHDFTSNGYTGWIKHISASILSDHKRNVIAVDWQSGAEPPYEQAVANARVVALEIIALLNCIKSKFGMGGEKIHIIGHGVGAHIAGYVGESAKQIKKITGLDPSGPYFEGMPNFVRLDPSDATYIEVIHTDYYSTDSQGTCDHLGHRDFFVNGPHRQPGCNDSSSNLNLVAVERNNLKQGQILPGCSHKRSFKYYIESIEVTNCKFIGFSCEDFNTFTEGACSCESTGVFSLDSYESNAQQQDKGLYLLTNGIRPYCVIPYKLVMRLSNFTRASEHLSGYIEVLFKGNSIDVVNGSSYLHRKSQTFSKGEKKELLIYGDPPQITSFKEVQMKWKTFVSRNCQLHQQTGLNCVLTQETLSSRIGTTTPSNRVKR
ncbi:pancreatic triacylglycerol lipase-like isoform X2 [Agrilus planipennis]|uniref:Pancreatic triacylglycerol lipase-like isoform X2 n=1 Tax=Agrilus planipennis TaxID=224129 RepID=A0A1W4X020_AGRPL|nr:pancreatic triacylglycerol lipase-like isoform X2 [Agrilus planipennis]